MKRLFYVILICVSTYMVNVQAQTDNQSNDTLEQCDDFPGSDIFDEIDRELEDMIECGALEDDVSTMEAMPRWKRILARCADYLIMQGSACKEAITRTCGSCKRAWARYWYNNGGHPSGVQSSKNIS